MNEIEEKTTADEAPDYHTMWSRLGMNLEDHDKLLGAVGQMYGDVYLTQENRPKTTSYLDGVAGNLHSGRIREILDSKADGRAKKIVGTFCLYVPEVPTGRPTRSRSTCRATPARSSRASPASSSATCAPTSRPPTS